MCLLNNYLIQRNIPKVDCDLITRIWIEQMINCSCFLQLCYVPQIVVIKNVYQCSLCFVTCGLFHRHRSTEIWTSINNRIPCFLWVVIILLCRNLIGGWINRRERWASHCFTGCDYLSMHQSRCWFSKFVLVKGLPAFIQYQCIPYSLRHFVIP